MKSTISTLYATLIGRRDLTLCNHDKDFAIFSININHWNQRSNCPLPGFLQTLEDARHLVKRQGL